MKIESFLVVLIAGSSALSASASTPRDANAHLHAHRHVAPHRHVPDTARGGVEESKSQSGSRERSFQSIDAQYRGG